MRIYVEYNSYYKNQKWEQIWEVGAEFPQKELFHNWEELRTLINTLEEAGKMAFGREKK